MSGPDSGRATAPSPWELLRAFRRCWFPATSLGLLVALLAAGAVWYLLPNRFTATTLLHVSAQEPTILATSEAHTDFGLYQKAQAALISSRLVLNAVLKRDAIASLAILPRDPEKQIAWLQAELKVDYKTGPEFMRLSLTAERAADVKTLVGEITDVYLKEVVYKERTRKLERLKHLQEIQSKYEESLRSHRETVRKLILALGSGDAQVLAVKQRYAAEALGQAERELLQTQSELRRARLAGEVKRRRIKAITEKGLSGSATPIDLEVDADPSIQTLLAHKARVEKDIERIEQVSVRGRREPAMKPLLDQSAALDAQLEKRRKLLRPEVVKRFADRAVRDLQAEFASLEERASLLQDLETSLVETVERLRKQTQAATVGQSDIESFRTEIAQSEKIADRIGSEVERLKLEVDAPQRVHLIEEPVVMESASTRFRAKALLGAAFGALLLAIGLMTWREYSFRRVELAEEITQHLPVVACLPRLEASATLAAGANGTHARDLVFVEHVDAARTSLLHLAKHGEVQAILVTSAVGGEGKTSLACQLAASLARAGFQTLLIDGDMRRPACHRVFGAPASPGFSELLRNENSLEEVLQATPLDHLTLMAAGRWNYQTSQFLARERMPDILAALRQQYEYIVIDSAPVLPLVDSLLLAQHVDGVVLSVLRRVSQLPLFESAVERLQSVGVNLLGAVMNGMSPKVHASRYHYEPASSTLAPESLLDIDLSGVPSESSES
ncbi:hypothetical protein AYO40_03720 [Planctomycetaceae bacterium SCGC AG-212-D15]|nr:hypothetical protein AYO40_03720 [Planctomycetaceae bacterium SCGC AG-212-D15]